MATCPSCGVSTREQPGAMVVEDALEAKPIGSFSLAGHQMKFVATGRLRLRCGVCGWSVLGHIDGDHFVAQD